MDNIVRRGGFLLLVLVASALILPGAAAAQDPESVDQNPELVVSEDEKPIIELQSGEEAIADQVIVKFKEEASRADKADARSDEGLEKKEDLDLVDAEVDKIEGQSVEEAVSDLNNRPEVEYAEPDFKVHPTGYTDERRFGDLWGLDNTGQSINGSTGLKDVDVNAPEAFAVTQGNEDLVVAVIDDGVDFSHPDLKDRAWKNPGESGGGKETNGIDDDGDGYVDDVNGWDFHNKDNTVHDVQDLHGTHVSGTIAASMNGDGVVGVAPNVKIMALKFIGPRGGATSDAILAIDYAKKMGAKISNNSWGGGPYSQALKDAIDASGMLFVASAGNNGEDSDTTPQYPAAYNSANILSVAAVDNSGNLASFSNYGATSVDISAPGVSVLSSIPDRRDLSAVALSSVGSSGKAVTAGFGVEEIGDAAKQGSFMKKAFDAVGRGSQQVVLVDDDASDAPSFKFRNVRSSLRDAIRSATGTNPQVINVPYGSNGPDLSLLSGKTVVWSTGEAWLSFFDSATGGVAPTLTRADRSALTDFLSGGGKLVLTGMDALSLNENDSFVTDKLGLKVQSDVNQLKTFSGSSDTTFAGESYDLNGSTANSNFHDVLTPADPKAIQGVYPGRGSWDFLNGTSMAAPHATGVAALAASVNPALLDDPVALKKAVMDGGKPDFSTDGKTVTGDMVDARAALTHADATKPRLKLPSDIVEEATSKDGAKVNFTATATDNVDGDVSVSCASDSGLKSGDTFPIGTTQVNCSAKDNAGNEAEDSFNVKVQDTTVPTIKDVPSDMTQEATSKDGARVSYTSPTATDAVDGEVSVSCEPASGSTFGLGDTTVNCSASDKAGNEVTGSFNVKVQDTTTPQLKLPSDIVEEATSKDGARVSYTATATDNVDGDVSVSCASDSDLKSGSTFPIGTTKVNCSTKDRAGNKATGSFNVKVQDSTKPQISGLPTSDLTKLAAGASGSNVSFPTITATDAVDGGVAVSCTSASGLKSGNTFPVGTTGVTCSAKDKAGNEATGKFNVKVSYDFKGFFRPVDNPNTVNSANAGRAIPVKFTLGGNMGLEVFYKDDNGSAYPRSASMTCGSTNPVDAVEETVTANASGLSYDETTGQYTYVWKTSKNWAGTCRQLVVKLKDGETYRAYFQFG